MYSKCPECGFIKWRKDWEEPNAYYDQSRIRHVCDWCGYEQIYYYYPDGRPGSGAGRHAKEGAALDREFPKTTTHCDKPANLVGVYDCRAHYYCEECDCNGFLDLWQDPDRTLTGEDIYWSTRIDCCIVLE